MSYCPECLIEYREGAAECIDCHVPLLPGPPPAVETPRFAPDVKLVTVRTFHGPTASMDAELERNVLKEEGILSALPGDTGAEVIPGIDVVQLLVREEDAARADEILAAFENAEAEVPENEPGELPKNNFGL
jgi:hypothetical protein